MLGGCRNGNITRSALYVAMVHVFQYSVTMPVAMGYFNLLITWRTHTHTHTHTMHNRSAFRMWSVLYSY